MLRPIVVKPLQKFHFNLVTPHFLFLSLFLFLLLPLSPLILLLLLLLLRGHITRAEN